MQVATYVEDCPEISALVSSVQPCGRVIVDGSHPDAPSIITKLSLTETGYVRLVTYGDVELFCAVYTFKLLYDKLSPIPEIVMFHVPDE